MSSQGSDRSGASLRDRRVAAYAVGDPQRRRLRVRRPGAGVRDLPRPLSRRRRRGLRARPPRNRAHPDADPAAAFVLGVIEDLLARVIDRLVVIALLWLAFAAAFAAFRIHVPLPDRAASAPAGPLPQPALGGGKAERFISPKGAGPWYRACGARPGRRPRRARRGGCRRGRRRARDGRRRRVTGDSGRRRCYARPALRLHPFRHPQPFRPRPRGGSRRPVGALDAFVDGGERIVDLAAVNGRVFVNNVSLGFYASAVQRDSYRGAKIRTLLWAAPEVIGPCGTPPDLRWTGPYGEYIARAGRC